MRKKSHLYLIFVSLLSFALLESCTEGDDLELDGDGPGGADVTIPDFNFPSSITFEQNLSAYNIYEGSAHDLLPASDYHLIELSSELFTDYSQKQRLVKVPEGERMTRNADGSLNFPDNTILVKTFYYYFDEREVNLGKRLIETRLMIKENNLWNIATYVWNAEQTEATLALNGLDTQVNWVSEEGINRSTLYRVPTENECIACHQSNSTTIPLGTTLRNLNRAIIRNNLNLNQIAHLQSVGAIDAFDINLVSQIADYNNTDESLVNRARAYMDMNCAHCHNPNAWEEPAEEDMDFRYETPYNQTGIAQESDEIAEMVADGEMPFIGTTVLDDEGVQLIIAYINSL